jgi:2-polyprenyl-3-methyl-5-hydroxy-6-metoxy-1,4-benzoquinol methylase|tara:strand:- start:1463 stop:2314 length:852 start_codon:yes stop_codon:yes gene_type:complete
MKNIKNPFLYAVKDHLASEEHFNLYWDKQKKIAWTDLGKVKDLSPYYESDNYISHQTENKSIINSLYSFARTIMLLYKFKQLKPFVKPSGRLLDVGCGTGNFLSYMNKKNFDVFGVDNNTTALKICAKKKLKVYNSLETVPDKAFDVVSLWHVLEHLPQPEKVIAKIHDLLTSKGVLIVAVPNFSSHDRLHYQNNWAALDVPRHLWHFTPEGLEEMLSSAGFKLLKKNPLWLDVFYISFLSEKLKGNNLALLIGLLKGCYFTVRSLFSKKYSSISFVFKKRAV